MIKVIFYAKKQLNHHRDSIKTCSACALLVSCLVPSFLLFALLYSVTTEECQYKEHQSSTKMLKKVLCFLFIILAISDFLFLKHHFKVYLKSDLIFFFNFSFSRRKHWQLFTVLRIYLSLIACERKRRGSLYSFEVMYLQAVQTEENLTVFLSFFFKLNFVQ